MSRRLKGEDRTPEIAAALDEQLTLQLIEVIAHVRDLGERLPTQVKVQKSREGSQLVVEAH